MSNALVVRTQRHKKIGDAASPMVFTLKRKSKDAKIFDLERIAQDIEALGGMSAEDVVHVGKAIVRQMRQVMTDGNSVRLDGFGIFHTTFKCRATEVAKDCTVKNIERVNIRFKVANTLRLVNDSNASTRGGGCQQHHLRISVRRRQLVRWQFRRRKYWWRWRRRRY